MQPINLLVFLAKLGCHPPWLPMISLEKYIDLEDLFEQNRRKLHGRRNHFSLRRERQLGM
jgi:hypothetical protein